MKGANLSNPACQLDVRFAHSKDGRPEIYDFLWEHVAPLYVSSGEKKVRIHVQPGWTKALSPVQWDHLIQKLSTDKRFHHSIERVNMGTGSLEMDVPVKELDHLLNTYNILFDSLLPYLKFDSAKLSMDFSRAGEQSVIMRTSHVQSEKVKSYLSTRLTRPKMQLTRFGIRSPLHEALSRKRSVR